MSASFIDSNIFIYLFDETSKKSLDAEEFLSDALASGQAAISFQVVQEVLNVITTKLSSPASIEEARRFMAVWLSPFWKVMPSAELYDRALGIQARYQYHFYDSLILAAAMMAGCTTLLTEDLQHGQRIETLEIVNPFL